ncbi:MAG: NAD-dependent epimerase/dehydratase family protein [Chloroflexota bacterium]|nr:NAD-dependent epimerase/dehydratase family protein [Chloroflexota bacterium]
MTNAKGRVLVTGGAGFIGSYIVEELLRRGYEVRVFDSLEPQVHGKLHETATAPEYLVEDVEFIVGDVLDREAVVRALEGVDYLLHQAALIGVPQSMYDIRRYTEVNSLGGATVLDAAVNTPTVRDRLKKMVVASSKSIYGEGAYRCEVHGAVYPRFRPLEQLQRGDWQVRCPVEGCGRGIESIPTAEDKPLMPVNTYAIGKRDHEEMFLCIGHAYNIPAVALRYWQVYGARQALSNPYTGVAAIFSSRILGGNPPPIYEDGRQLVDFVHVTDIARANALALEHSAADFEAINIGTGAAMSVVDVAWTLIREMGADKQGMAPQVLGKYRPGDTRDCYPDISRARRLLGYEPAVSFEQGAAELVSWVRDQQGKVEDRFEQAQRELRDRGLAGG